MEDKKTIATETAENVASKESKIEAAHRAPEYDPDDYLKQYYPYDDVFHFTDKCFSCRRWLTYECGDPINSCKYESAENSN